MSISKVIDHQVKHVTQELSLIIEYGTRVQHNSAFVSIPHYSQILDHAMTTLVRVGFYNKTMAQMCKFPVRLIKVYGKIL